jgi:hypothetical protein
MPLTLHPSLVLPLLLLVYLVAVLASVMLNTANVCVESSVVCLSLPGLPVVQQNEIE